MFCPKSFCTSCPRTEHNDKKILSHPKTTVNKQKSMKPKTEPTLFAFQKKLDSTPQTLSSERPQKGTSEQAGLDKLNSQGITKDPIKITLKDVLNREDIVLVLPVLAAQCERAVSAQNWIKNSMWSSLSTSMLEDFIRISSEGPCCADGYPMCKLTIREYLNT